MGSSRLGTDSSRGSDRSSLHGQDSAFGGWAKKDAASSQHVIFHHIVYILYHVILPIMYCRRSPCLVCSSLDHLSSGSTSYRQGCWYEDMAG